MTQKIGRNAPCPCGSGKKFKKCCYGKDAFNQPKDYKEVHHVIPPYENIDYGKPLLDKKFFKKNTVHEISAQRLFYSNLLMPEIEALASEISNQMKDRGSKEAVVIENTEDVKELIAFMEKGLDSLNYEKLVKKLLRHKETSVPIIIEKLKQPKRHDFLEISIRVIHGSGVNYSEAILEIIRERERRAYPVSQLCMLLGFYQNDKSEKLLWDYYHYFKEHYNDETYSDGPLIALWEIQDRRKLH
jgi:hypothetical protein